VDALIFGVDFCEKLMKYVRLWFQQYPFPIVPFDKLVYWIVGDAVVGTDLYYCKIPRFRLRILTQKVRKAALFGIVKIPVETDKQGIVRGT
jgi:hypothetical protein